MVVVLLLGCIAHLIIRQCDAQCQRGTYGLGAECLKCSPGTFSSSIGATSSSSCEYCGYGTWSSIEGATSSLSCLACNSGTFSTVSGASSTSSCISCQSGTYSSNVGTCICLSGYQGPTCSACLSDFQVLIQCHFLILFRFPASLLAFVLDT